MNTSRSGSRSIWRSDHSRRCFRMSGRSCSIAWPVFFARHPPAHEEAMQPGNVDDQAESGQVRAQFLKRDVLACLPKGQNIRRALLNPPGSRVATPRFWGEVARLAPLGLPGDRCRRRNTKPACRCTATHPAINRRQKPRAQIHRERLSHPCWPPSPARILNQKSCPTGIPSRCKMVENRSKRPPIPSGAAQMVGDGEPYCGKEYSGVVN